MMDKRNILLQPMDDEAFKVTSLRRLYLPSLNLLANPGFETAGVGDPDFWADWMEDAGDGAFANEITLIHEGADAVKATGSVSNNTRVYQDEVVITGKKYRFRFWTRGDGVNGGQYRIQNLTLGGDIVSTTSTGVTGTTYTIVVKEFTIPSETTRIRIVLYSPAASGGICYFDTCDLYLLN